MEMANDRWDKKRVESGGNDENRSPPSPCCGIKVIKTYSKRKGDGTRNIFHSTASFFGTGKAVGPYPKTYDLKRPFRIRNEAQDVNTLIEQPTKRFLLPPHRIGFPNRHQTCYLNAILQCLLAQPTLVRDLLDLKFDNAESVPSSGLLKSFRALAEAKEKGDQNLVSEEVLNLKNILANLDSTFEGDSMQDADEFLLKFCDTVREQCKSLHPEEEDPVSANFEYEMETLISCHACGAETRKVSKNLICLLLQPTPGKVCSIGRLLEKTFSSSQLTSWNCEKCQEKNTSASLSYKLKSLPRVLVLHLPRSDYDSLRAVKYQKIQSSVMIPECINISSIVIDGISMPSTIPYPLSSCNVLGHEDDDEEFKLNDDKKNANIPSTPEKMRNLSNEQINKLNDEDSIALAIRHSLKDNNSRLMSEEDQVEAAIHQSLTQLNGDYNGNEQEPEESSSIDNLEHNQLSYRLTSVVSHLGSSVSSGHYIADVYRFGKKSWFRYNDLSVSKRNMDSVRSEENMRNGYIFIYTYNQLFSDL